MFTYLRVSFNKNFTELTFWEFAMIVSLFISIFLNFFVIIAFLLKKNNMFTLIMHKLYHFLVRTAFLLSKLRENIRDLIQFNVCLVTFNKYF